MLPKISIIIPNYNKSSFITETINSVKNQTFQNWEMIIVDDASSDNSPKLLKDIAYTDSRITIRLNSQNNGGSFCRNEGIKLAKGEYVIFLDSDDLLEPFCLERRLVEVKANPNFDLWVFPMGAFKHKKGDLNVSYYWYPPKHNFLYAFLAHKLPWAICQPIWSMSILKGLNGFDTHFSRLQDVEIHTRAILKGAKVITFPKQEVDCFYRIDEQRITSIKANFYTNWVNGAIQYYNKFYPEISKDQKKYLTGTLLETLGMISNKRRLKQISKDSFMELKKELIKTCNITIHKKILRIYATLELISPIHPKGLKYIIQKFI